MTLRLGSLCTGYGGLDLAVASVLDVEHAWVSDVCKFGPDGAGHHEPCRSPCTILAHRFPGVPNLGDLTKLDWHNVPPIEVLTAGYPCQPFSHAGRRRGTDDPRHLWPFIREAIRVLRPRLTFLENVDGHRSLGFDRVVGDMAEDGMHVRWVVLPASGVGAPHQRKRLFIAITPDAEDAGGIRRDVGWDSASLQGASGGARRGVEGSGGVGVAGDSLSALRGDDLMLPSAVQDILPTPRATRGGSSTETTYLLGTPTARDHKGSGQGERLEESERRGQVEAQVLSLDLLPTPAVNDMGAAYTPETGDAWTARMKAAHNNGNGHGNSLSIDAQRVAMTLLPTTTTTDAKASGAADYTTGHAGTTLTDATVRQPSRWGKYAAAIARWERITRPAPEPTNITDGYLKALAKRLARLDKRPAGMRGTLRPRRQLAARFSEWMMGLALGWITDVPGITRNEALKAAGNGVVPQQATEALRFLLAMPTGREIAAAHEPDDLLELLSAGGAA